jgi:HEAT repeat protein
MRQFVVVGPCVLVAALACGHVRAADADEPTYEGKSLSYWVQRLRTAENENDRTAAANAIQSFGPDAAPAVPALLKLLEDRSANYRNQVVSILCELGPVAKSAVPALIKSLEQKTCRCPDGMASILGSIGPAAKDAVPTLTALLKHSEPGVRAVSAVALWKIARNPNLVPALAEALQQERWAEPAADALGEIGPQAKAALPALELANNYSELGISSAAWAAIKKIDPDAAQKLERRDPRFAPYPPSIRIDH